MEKYILEIFMAFLVLSFTIAYLLRDKSKDKEKADRFFNG
jgi:hypothetical protein